MAGSAAGRHEVMVSLPAHASTRRQGRHTEETGHAGRLRLYCLARCRPSGDVGGGGVGGRAESGRWWAEAEGKTRAEAVRRAAPRPPSARSPPSAPDPKQDQTHVEELPFNPSSRAPEFLRENEAERVDRPGRRARRPGPLPVSSLPSFACGWPAASPLSCTPADLLPHAVRKIHVAVRRSPSHGAVGPEELTLPLLLARPDVPRLDEEPRAARDDGERAAEPRGGVRHAE